MSLFRILECLNRWWRGFAVSFLFSLCFSAAELMPGFWAMLLSRLFGGAASRDLFVVTLRF